MKYYYLPQCSWTLKVKEIQKLSYIVWFHFYEMFRVDKSIETKGKSVVTSGDAVGGWNGVTATGCEVSFEVVTTF